MSQNFYKNRWKRSIKRLALKPVAQEVLERCLKRHGPMKKQLAELNSAWSISYNREAAQRFHSSEPSSGLTTKQTMQNLKPILKSLSMPLTFNSNTLIQSNPILN